MTSRVMRFMMSIMAGIIPDMVRFTNRLVLVRSRFTVSNLFSSNSWVSKALTTSIPSRFSRTTRFKRSMSFCTTWNFGITRLNMENTTVNSRTTARAMIHDMDLSLARAWRMPPTAMMGA